MLKQNDVITFDEVVSTSPQPAPTAIYTGLVNALLSDSLITPQQLELATAKVRLAKKPAPSEIKEEDFKSTAVGPSKPQQQDSLVERLRQIDNLRAPAFTLLQWQNHHSLLAHIIEAHPRLLAVLTPAQTARLQSMQSCIKNDTSGKGVFTIYQVLYFTEEEYQKCRIIFADLGRDAMKEYVPSQIAKLDLVVLNLMKEFRHVDLGLTTFAEQYKFFKDLQQSDPPTIEDALKKLNALRPFIPRHLSAAEAIQYELKESDPQWITQNHHFFSTTKLSLENAKAVFAELKTNAMREIFADLTPLRENGNLSRTQALVIAKYLGSDHEKSKRFRYNRHLLDLVALGYLTLGTLLQLPEWEVDRIGYRRSLLGFVALGYLTISTLLQLSNRDVDILQHITGIRAEYQKRLTATLLGAYDVVLWSPSTFQDIQHTLSTLPSELKGKAVLLRQPGLTATTVPPAALAPLAAGQDAKQTPSSATDRLSIMEINILRRITNFRLIRAEDLQQLTASLFGTDDLVQESPSKFQDSSTTTAPSTRAALQPLAVEQDSKQTPSTADRFSVYELSAECEWQLTDNLDSTELQELDFTETPTLWRNSRIPMSVYDDIRKKGGYYLPALSGDNTSMAMLVLSYLGFSIPKRTDSNTLASRAAVDSGLFSHPDAPPPSPATLASSTAATTSSTTSSELTSSP